MSVSQEEFQKRIDENLKKAQEGVGPVPLFKPQTPSVKGTEIDPSLVHPPVLTDQEKIDGYNKLAQVEAARIQYEQAKAGNPMAYYVMSWWKLLAGGVGGFILSRLAGCG
jgi:hypothetical protein